MKELGTACLMKKCACLRRLIGKAAVLFLVMVPLALATRGGTVTFTAGTETAQQGNPVEVPITVTGFSGVTEFQFSVTWDPAVLTLESFPLGISGGSIHIDANSGGVMSVVWNGSFSGTSVSDGYTLLQLDFLAVGNPGSRSYIDFGDVPTQEGVSQRAGIGLTAGTFFPVSGEVDIASVPEPSTLALAGCGFAAALLRRGLTSR